MRMNRMCCIEFHLPSAIDSEEYTLELKVSKDKKKQCLVLKHQISPLFLSAKVFNAQLDTNPEGNVLRKHARQECITTLRAKHSDPNDDANTTINTVMQIALPFVCDNIFDKDLVPYPGTFYKFKCLKFDEDAGLFLKLDIVLVEKEKNKKDIMTPQKENAAVVMKLDRADLLDDF